MGGQGIGVKFFVETTWQLFCGEMRIFESVKPTMIRRPLICILPIIMLIVIPSPLFAWQGNVVGITDGDTIHVLHDNQEIKIRLWGIDCPEKHQDFGNRAKQQTSELAYGRTVEILEIDKDRYGRTVAMVKLPNGQVLNEALICSGMAWVYRKYCKREEECARWLELEAKARDQKIGLWSMPEPIPPWDFRKH